MGSCLRTASRSRSASDPSDKKKTKFSAVARNDIDGEEAGGKGQSEEPPATTPPTSNSTNETLANTSQHIELTGNHELANDMKRRFSSDFETKLITVNIKKQDGESQALPIMNSLTVSQMKSLIAKHIGVEEPRQRLKYNHMTLESAQLCSNYNIADGDTIELDVLDDANIFQITVDYKDGTIKKDIYCMSSSNLLDFRKEVQGKIPTVALNEQQFFYDGKELNDDEMTLRDYGITNRSTIKFEWKSTY